MNQMNSNVREMWFYAIRMGVLIGIIKMGMAMAQASSWEAAGWTFLAFFFVGLLAGFPLWVFRETKKRHPVGDMDKILLLCIGMAVLFGIVHDQITVRLSWQYYETGHFPIPGVEDPTLLGLIWGVLGTWWVGAIFGLLMTLAAYAGSRPPIRANQLIKPLACLMIGTEILAWTMGAIAYYWVASGQLHLPDVYATQIPLNEHAGFMADWFTNGTAYTCALLGGIVLGSVFWKKRQGRLQESLD